MLQNDTNARLSKELGNSGVFLTSAQGLTAVNAIKIQCVTGAVINVEVDWVNAGSPQAITLIANQVIHGNFTAITVVSGSVVAF